MSEYVPAGHQLVIELYVRDLEKTREFYKRLGFEVVRDEGDFAVLKWDESLIFLEQVNDLPPAPAAPVANIRIMVPDVNHYWDLARQIRAEVMRPIADRYYGLRDFTIAGPDGLSLRFATRLPN